MPRARVSPEKRKRTARACDSCKRSKLKCNGLLPCSTCSKEDRECTFGVSRTKPDDRFPPHKRQQLDNGSSSFQNAPNSLGVQIPNVPLSLALCDLTANGLQTTLQSPSGCHTSIQHPAGFSEFSISAQSTPSDQKSTSVVAHSPFGSNSQGKGSAAGPEEEAVIYNFPRLLEDPTGRLQYVGDSSPLSYLQIIRKDVESIAGSSPFTLDPRQHEIVENTASLPQNIRSAHLLPDRYTAKILVDSFLTNTCGLFQVFNNNTFMGQFNNLYSDPLYADATWLCLFNLTLAIGVVLATPSPGTQESAIIQKLRGHPIDQAEVFYCNARRLGDPKTGFENADFWSIQALLLMAIYNLAVSKRNAAFAYCGMASRSGFALGLHREETLTVFDEEEQAMRRNLWRSVFVLDCFLAASMGRPTAISEDDCPEQTLKTSTESKSFPTSLSFPTGSRSDPGKPGLEASTRSCRVIGIILKRVYSKTKISTKLAQEIYDECALWPEALDPSLHWRQMTAASLVSSTQCIAILHVNLLYCHTIILLTRPFFLILINKVQKAKKNGSQRPPQDCSLMERFSEGCVLASRHSIILVQNALEGRFLSYQNPFVIYFLFAAALIVLSNEFFALYAIPMAQKLIQNSISIMDCFAATDQLALRLRDILLSFRDVVDGQEGHETERHAINISGDPILNFLSTGAEGVSLNSTRRSSTISNISGSTRAPARGNTDIMSIP